MATVIEGPALLAWLAGEWSVERDINDGAGTFTGLARFDPQVGGTLRWHESGTLSMGGDPLPVTRTLTIDDAGTVRFDDGREFHHLSLTDGTADAFHPCGPDDYTGRYERIGDDTLLVTWQVAGPGRADVIRSRYARLVPTA